MSTGHFGIVTPFAENSTKVRNCASMAKGVDSKQTMDALIGLCIANMISSDLNSSFDMVEVNLEHHFSQFINQILEKYDRIGK